VQGGLGRGEGRFGQFEIGPPPAADLHADALAVHKRARELHDVVLFQGADERPAYMRAS